MRVTIPTLPLALLVVVAQSLAAQTEQQSAPSSYSGQTSGQGFLGVVNAQGPPSGGACGGGPCNVAGTSNSGIVLCADWIGDPARVEVTPKEVTSGGFATESTSVVLPLPPAAGPVTHWAMACPRGGEWTYFALGCFAGPLLVHEIYLVMVKDAPLNPACGPQLVVSAPALIASVPSGGPVPSSAGLVVIPDDEGSSAIVWCTIPDATGGSDVRQFEVTPPSGGNQAPGITSTLRQGLRAMTLANPAMPPSLVLSDIRLARTSDGFLHAGFRAHSNLGSSVLAHARLPAADSELASAGDWIRSAPTEFAMGPPTGSPPCPPSPGAAALLWDLASGAPTTTSSTTTIGFFGDADAIPDGPLRITASPNDGDLHAAYVKANSSGNTLHYRRWDQSCGRWTAEAVVATNHTSAEPEDIDIKAASDGSVSIISKLVETQEVDVELARMEATGSSFATTNLSDNDTTESVSFLDCEQSSVVGLFVNTTTSGERRLNFASRLTNVSDQELIADPAALPIPTEGIAFDIETPGLLPGESVVITGLDFGLIGAAGTVPIEVWVARDPGGAFALPPPQWHQHHCGEADLSSLNPLTTLDFNPQWTLRAGDKLGILVRTPGTTSIRAGLTNSAGTSGADSRLRIPTGRLLSNPTATPGSDVLVYAKVRYGLVGTEPTFQTNSGDLALDIAQATGAPHREACVDLPLGTTLPISVTYENPGALLFLGVNFALPNAPAPAPLLRTSMGRIINIRPDLPDFLDIIPLGCGLGLCTPGTPNEFTLAVPFPADPMLLGMGFRLQVASSDSTSNEGFFVSQPIRVNFTANPEKNIPGPFENDSTTTFNLPMGAPPFRFFGQTYSSVVVSSNGRLMFGSDDGGAPPPSSPTSALSNFIQGPRSVGIWHDLVPTARYSVALHYEASTLRVAYRGIPMANHPATADFEIALITPASGPSAPTIVTMKGLRSITGLVSPSSTVIGITPGGSSPPPPLTLLTPGGTVTTGPRAIALSAGPGLPLPSLDSVLLLPSPSGGFTAFAY